MDSLYCIDCGKEFSGWSPEKMVGCKYCPSCADDEIARLNAIVEPLEALLACKRCGPLAIGKIESNGWYFVSPYRTPSGEKPTLPEALAVALKAKGATDANTIRDDS